MEQRTRERPEAPRPPGKEDEERVEQEALPGDPLFLCRREGKDPDQLVAVGKAEAEGAVQSYLDWMKREDRSVRYVNTSLHQLETFFRSNGFRKESQLDLEGYHQPTRYRKREGYIPTPEYLQRTLRSDAPLIPPPMIMAS